MGLASYDIIHSGPCRGFVGEASDHPKHASGPTRAGAVHAGRAGRLRACLGGGDSQSWSAGAASCLFLFLSSDSREREQGALELRCHQFQRGGGLLPCL